MCVWGGGGGGGGGGGWGGGLVGGGGGDAGSWYRLMLQTRQSDLNLVTHIEREKGEIKTRKKKEKNDINSGKDSSPHAQPGKWPAVL